MNIRPLPNRYTLKSASLEGPNKTTGSNPGCLTATSVQTGLPQYAVGVVHLVVLLRFTPAIEEGSAVGCKVGRSALSRKGSNKIPAAGTCCPAGP